MRNITHTLVFLASVLSCLAVQAQTDTCVNRCIVHSMHPFSYSMHPFCSYSPTLQQLENGSRHLQLEVDACGFFHDAENNMPFAKGFTVTGFRLDPTLTYGINERAQLRVGIDAMTFAGLDSMYRIRPSFSLVYMPAKWLQLVAGTLFGEHRLLLSEPVHYPARWIYNGQENGLQIITRTSFWSSDTWLDWEHYLTPWTADQERFTFGSQHTYNLFCYRKFSGPCPGLPYKLNDTTADNTGNKRMRASCIYLPNNNIYGTTSFKIELPVHFIAHHRGGEVKTIDTNTVTTFNERIGLRMKYQTHSGVNKRTNHFLTLDLPFYFYKLSDKSLDADGWGLYPTLSYNLALPTRSQGILSLNASAGYWHGEHYFNPYGSPQFWSANSYSTLLMPASGTFADTRDMLTFSIALQHSFRNINLGLQVDSYTDLAMNKTDFLFSFFMRYTGRFVIF